MKIFYKYSKTNEIILPNTINRQTIFDKNDLDSIKNAILIFELEDFEDTKVDDLKSLAQAKTIFIPPKPMADFTVGYAKDQKDRIAIFKTALETRLKKFSPNSKIDYIGEPTFTMEHFSTFKTKNFTTQVNTANHNAQPKEACCCTCSLF